MSSVHFDGHDVDQDQTSVSLVSNGAECVMLSKKFFTEHATEEVRRSMRRKVRPYPSEDALQENLQIKVDWDIYKRKLIQDFVTQITHKT